jgi:phage baseplate assembly protein W
MANSFLGQDTKLPISNKFEPVKDIDVLNQDIQILLTTIPGERVMRPDYGCNLYKRIWDNIDDVARDGIDDIVQAIRTFEPRVTLLQVDSTISRDEGVVVFTVTYKVIDENTPRNLVFPFQTAVS